MLKSAEIRGRNIITAFKRLSTATQPTISNKPQTFRTEEINPENHSSNNDAQFYTVPESVRKQLFTYGGIPKTYLIQAKTFNELCVMIRQPALDIMTTLKAQDLSKPCLRFALYGVKGAGKSLTLAHLLHFAYNKGFLLVHVPWVGSWMRRPQEISNSETKEGFIDLNIDAAAWLMHFKTQNSHLLVNSELTVSEDIVWSKRETTPKGAPLTEVIEQGINRIKFASESVVVLARELKKLAKEGKCKVFVAVDGFNAFFYPKTRVLTEKKEVVHPKNITLTEAFLELTKFDWNNSAAVVTLDEIAIAAEDHISHMPWYLLGKEGFEHYDPFVPILVPNYNSKELTSCLDYYRERMWIKAIPGLDEELAFLSAGNPYKLLHLCNPL